MQSQSYDRDSCVVVYKGLYCPPKDCRSFDANDGFSETCGLARPERYSGFVPILFLLAERNFWGIANKILFDDDTGLKSLLCELIFCKGDLRTYRFPGGVSPVGCANTVVAYLCLLSRVLLDISTFFRMRRHVGIGAESRMPLNEQTLHASRTSLQVFSCSDTKKHDGSWLEAVSLCR